MLLLWVKMNFGVGFVQALHEALMRQEELLAYIDGQEEKKFRVSCLMFLYILFFFIMFWE